MLSHKIKFRASYILTWDAQLVNSNFSGSIEGSLQGPDTRETYVENLTLVKSKSRD